MLPRAGLVELHRPLDLGALHVVAETQVGDVHEDVADPAHVDGDHGEAAALAVVDLVALVADLGQRVRRDERGAVGGAAGLVAKERPGELAVRHLSRVLSDDCARVARRRRCRGAGEGRSAFRPRCANRLPGHGCRISLVSLPFHGHQTRPGRNAPPGFVQVALDVVDVGGTDLDGYLDEVDGVRVVVERSPRVVVCGVLHDPSDERGLVGLARHRRAGVVDLLRVGELTTNPEAPGGACSSKYATSASAPVRARATPA
ncbi:hypothetical protein CLV40_11334 [Actinokineospora auranticolor]|uniref:Uncharacterized protein n=1 Tax=Actinokineospora auranticolor TaxID=155976 RepID=A0A2S6GK35_9PSEU|nr:hypothetical protein CLV40_11334 [Actinokineospora auranticolor]